MALELGDISNGGNITVVIVLVVIVLVVIVTMVIIVTMVDSRVEKELSNG